ncbi:hypothetical protein M501DRAFT_934874 [Patellaria atrata CBS 101060]|uniref:Swiss Army Knife RNA repair protein HAD domain-containing protein n=1 Tax=Patellaria atrata CBS 101060 TaxID=1346257 RepID=A0A9P4S9F1_9PEZI|nr:hypothetical protein M501DRAFT_934874 [Patellaria atrata CBS 101060]
MLTSLPNGQTTGSIKPIIHTITALRRWSCDDKELPPVQDVKEIHVYDFDNTLFASPLPNRQLWHGPTIGQLQSPSIFLNGGWWHDATILAATGEGVEKEEPRAWEGWWNEQIVDLVNLTMEQKDALNVLLTGRAEPQFAELIKRMVRSRKLEFDMVCLKPTVGPASQTFANTMAFKQELLKDIVYTYSQAEEIRVYEDRIKHVTGFRSFFENFNLALMSPEPPIPRKAIKAEVIHVAERATVLDPTTEIAEIQSMINSHNTLVKSGTSSAALAKPMQISRTVFYTGYLISPPTTDQLRSFITIPNNIPENDIRHLANSILIVPRPCPQSILDKVGGLGAKLTWRITGTSVLDNKLWAARVEPVPATAKYHSDNRPPIVILATRGGARPQDAQRIQNWQPVPPDKAFEFETTVGEKVLLRIEEEYDPHRFVQPPPKRLHPREEDANNHPDGGRHARQPGRADRGDRYDGRQGGRGYDSYRGSGHPRGRGGPANHGHDNRDRHGNQGGRGGNAGGRRERGGFAPRGGRENRGRQRGGHAQYRSLDDMPDGRYDDGGTGAYGGSAASGGGLYNAY